MKKSTYLLMAAAGLGLASCSQEEMTTAIGHGDGNYSVTIRLPHSYAASRAAAEEFGTGTVADQLMIAVYDATTGTLMQEGVAEFENNSLQTVVNFNLVRGRSYNIAFFAQSKESMNTAGDTEPSNAVYVFDATAGTVTVNYENMTSENNLADAYDCFYNVLATGEIGTEDVTTSVTLNRPVGQVNWGTDDLVYKDGEGTTQAGVAAHDEAYGSQGQYIMTNLTVTKPYTILNLVDGTVSGNTSDVTIEAMAAPYTVEFPLDNDSETIVYTYVAMTYLLAPSANSTNYDLSLNVDNSGNTNLEEDDDAAVNTVVEVSAVPVQANYQTNIYGNLLSYDVSVTVKKNPTWTTPAYDNPLKYNGTTTYPTIPTNGEPLVISNASDLAGLADMVNGNNGQTATDLSDIEIQLGADFDMAGFALSFGSASYDDSGAVTGKAFAGTFDGQGHTISNVSVNGTEGSTTDIAGIFPNVDGGTIKNVKFTNVQLTNTFDYDLNSTSYTEIEKYSNATGVVGVLTDGTLEDITVNSGTVAGYNDVAGVVGKVVSGTVTNCTNGATVTGASNAGGVIGSAYAAENVTISNCGNTGDVTAVYAAGGVVGYTNGTVSECTNSGNIQGGQFSVGGIVGEQRSSGSVKGCTNSGNITVTNPANPYGAGGIVGWIRYIQVTEGITNTEVIEVSGNTNSGTIAGGVGAGGIVGIWYATGTCTSNINNAPSISAFQMGAGGIVGQTNTSTMNSAPNGSAQLTVTGNTSTTAWDDLSSPTNNAGAEQRGLIVGIDDGYVTMSGNTPDYNTPPTSDTTD